MGIRIGAAVNLRWRTDDGELSHAVAPISAHISNHMALCSVPMCNSMSMSSAQPFPRARPSLCAAAAVWIGKSGSLYVHKVCSIIKRGDPQTINTYLHTCNGPIDRVFYY